MAEPIIDPNQPLTEIIEDLDLAAKKEFDRRMLLHGDAYHYDNAVRDGYGLTVRTVGKFIGDWSVDLHIVAQRAVQELWSSKDIIYLAELGQDTPDLNRMVEKFHLDQLITARVQIQKPGDVVLRHLDDFSKHAGSEKIVTRFIIFLEDWQAGQSMCFGNTVLDYWEKGQIIYSNFEKFPHSTSNSGWNSRSILQITGVASSVTIQNLALNFGNITI